MFRNPGLRRFKQLLRLSLEQDPSRREFLKTAVQGAVLLTSATAAARVLTACTPRVSEETVVILGAGIAGLMAALTLSDKGRPSVIYEASSRIGGRMFTKEGFNSEGMSCELGGEFVDTSHADLIGLCKRFGIELDAFSDVDKDVEKELFYFGGKYYTAKQLIPLFQPIAKQLRLDQADKSRFQKLDAMSLAEYLSQFKNKTERWVLEMLRVAYVGEMGLEADEQSAMLFIYTLSPDTEDGFKLYGESDQAFKIRGGNIALIRAISDELSKRGVKIHLNHSLAGIKEHTDSLELVLSTGASSKLKVKTKRVICTIPFSAFRRVEGWKTLALPELKKQWIETMVYGTNSKLMLGYKTQAWRHSPGGRGRPPASNGMVYTDLFSQNTWDTSSTQRNKSGALGSPGILTTYLGGHDGAKAQPSDRKRAEEAIAKMFPQTKSQLSGEIALSNWILPPTHLGSYSTVKPGQLWQFQEIENVWELGGKLLFAGEHATDKDGGFMNGGCFAGRRAAETLA